MAFYLSSYKEHLILAIELRSITDHSPHSHMYSTGSRSLGCCLVVCHTVLLRPIITVKQGFALVITLKSLVY